MKVKILSIMVVILTLIAGITGFFVYQKIDDKRTIKQENARISEIEDLFSATEGREERCNILENVQHEMKNYENAEKSFENVSHHYETAISNMQNALLAEYDFEIAQNTLENLDSLKDMDTINASKDALTSLLSTMESEKDFVFPSVDTFENYKERITALTDSYTERVDTLEKAQKKADIKAKKEAAQKKAAEEKAKTHYENEYFSIDVPKEWAGYWSVEPSESPMPNGSTIAVYFASHNPEEENSGGGAEIHVLKFNPETDRLGYGNFAIPPTATYVGDESAIPTSNNIYIFVMSEAGGGFFWDDGGATITRKE